MKLEIMESSVFLSVQMGKYRIHFYLETVGSLLLSLSESEVSAMTSFLDRCGFLSRGFRDICGRAWLADWDRSGDGEN